MRVEELAERAFEEVADDEFRAAQDADISLPPRVDWAGLPRTKQFEYLEIAGRGGDASVFGQKIEAILSLPKVEAVTGDAETEGRGDEETVQENKDVEEPAAAELPPDELGDEDVPDPISDINFAELVTVSDETDVRLPEPAAAEVVPSAAPKKKSSKSKK